MGDESTRDPQPEPEGAPPDQPHRPNGWQAEPAHEWDQRPNRTWQTGAPETWSARPNDAWRTGASHSWSARPNPLWEGGAASETAPTLPRSAEAPAFPTGPTEPLGAPPAYGAPAAYGAPPLYAGASQPGYPQPPSPQVGGPLLPGAPAHTPPSYASAQVPPSYPPARPVPATPRRRTALWLGIGVVVVAVVIALIVMFSIWLGNQAQILWNGTAQPITTSSGSPVPQRSTPQPQATSAASPSAASPSSTPAASPESTAPAHEPTGDRVPLDVVSALPDGADFAVAPGSTWTDLGSTFLGEEDGELWATSLTSVSGQTGEDARATTEALLRLLSAGSVDGLQSVWVSGADGRSYEFLAAEADGIGVLARVEPESGRQFALMFGGATADVVANLILE